MTLKNDIPPGQILASGEEITSADEFTSDWQLLREAIIIIEKVISSIDCEKIVIRNLINKGYDPTVATLILNHYEALAKLLLALLSAKPIFSTIEKDSLDILRNDN